MANSPTRMDDDAALQSSRRTLSHELRIVPTSLAVSRNWRRCPHCCTPGAAPRGSAPHMKSPASMRSCETCCSKPRMGTRPIGFEPFASDVVLDGRREFVCDYVGHMDAAKVDRDAAHIDRGQNKSVEAVLVGSKRCGDNTSHGTGLGSRFVAACERVAGTRRRVCGAQGALRDCA